MVLYGFIWFYDGFMMVLYGFIWFYMVLYRFMMVIWFYLVLYGFMMVLYGFIWFYDGFMMVYDGWWFKNHLEKYEFVNGKDDIPIYEMENKIHG